MQTNTVNVLFTRSSRLALLKARSLSSTRFPRPPRRTVTTQSNQNTQIGPVEAHCTENATVGHNNNNNSSIQGSGRQFPTLKNKSTNVLNNHSAVRSYTPINNITGRRFTSNNHNAKDNNNHIRDGNNHSNNNNNNNNNNHANNDAKTHNINTNNNNNHTTSIDNITTNNNHIIGSESLNTATNPTSHTHTIPHNTNIPPQYHILNHPHQHHPTSTTTAPNFPTHTPIYDSTWSKQYSSNVWIQPNETIAGNNSFEPKMKVPPDIKWTTKIAYWFTSLFPVHISPLAISPVESLAMPRYQYRSNIQHNLNLTNFKHEASIPNTANLSHLNTNITNPAPNGHIPLQNTNQHLQQSVLNVARAENINLNHNNSTHLSTTTITSASAHTSPMFSEINHTNIANYEPISAQYRALIVQLEELQRVALEREAQLTAQLSNQGTKIKDSSKDIGNIVDVGTNIGKKKTPYEATIVGSTSHNTLDKSIKTSQIPPMSSFHIQSHPYQSPHIHMHQLPHKNTHFSPLSQYPYHHSHPQFPPNPLLSHPIPPAGTFAQEEEVNWIKSFTRWLFSYQYLTIILGSAVGIFSCVGLSYIVFGKLLNDTITSSVGELTVNTISSQQTQTSVLELTETIIHDQKVMDNLQWLFITLLKDPALQAVLVNTSQGLIVENILQNKEIQQQLVALLLLLLNDPSIQHQLSDLVAYLLQEPMIKQQLIEICIETLSDDGLQSTATESLVALWTNFSSSPETYEMLQQLLQEVLRDQSLIKESSNMLWKTVKSAFSWGSDKNTTVHDDDGSKIQADKDAQNSNKGQNVQKIEPMDSHSSNLTNLSTSKIDANNVNNNNNGKLLLQQNSIDDTGVVDHSTSPSSSISSESILLDKPPQTPSKSTTSAPFSYKNAQNDAKYIDMENIPYKHHITHPIQQVSYNQPHGTVDNTMPRGLGHSGVHGDDGGAIVIGKDGLVIQHQCHLDHTTQSDITKIPKDNLSAKDNAGLTGIDMDGLSEEEKKAKDAQYEMFLNSVKSVTSSIVNTLAESRHALSDWVVSGYQSSKKYWSANDRVQDNDGVAADGKDQHQDEDGKNSREKSHEKSHEKNASKEEKVQGVNDIEGVIESHSQDKKYDAVKPFITNPFSYRNPLTRWFSSSSARDTDIDNYIENKNVQYDENTTNKGGLVENHDSKKLNHNGKKDDFAMGSAVRSTNDTQNDKSSSSMQRSNVLQPTKPVYDPNNTNNNGNILTTNDGEYSKHYHQHHHHHHTHYDPFRLEKPHFVTSLTEKVSFEDKEYHKIAAQHSLDRVNKRNRQGDLPSHLVVGSGNDFDKKINEQINHKENVKVEEKNEKKGNLVEKTQKNENSKDHLSVQPLNQLTPTTSPTLTVTSPSNQTGSVPSTTTTTSSNHTSGSLVPSPPLQSPVQSPVQSPIPSPHPTNNILPSTPTLKLQLSHSTQLPREGGVNSHIHIPIAKNYSNTKGINFNEKNEKHENDQNNQKNENDQKNVDKNTPPSTIKSTLNDNKYNQSNSYPHYLSSSHQMMMNQPVLQQSFSFKGDFYDDKNNNDLNDDQKAR